MVVPAMETTHASSAAPVIAYVSLYRQQEKVLETASIAAMPLPLSRLGVVPLSFKISLGKLTPGRYECQVSVLDPAGHRVAFWVNPVMLVR